MTYFMSPHTHAHKNNTNYMKNISNLSARDINNLCKKIKLWGTELGFNDVGFSDIDLSTAEKHLINWLEKGYHGDMAWMQRHGTKRSRPQELVVGTQSIISVRMDYFPPEDVDPIMILNHPERAYISRYALGRDYHKLMRKRLQQLAHKIEQYIGTFGYRVFVDSAPVLEKPIAVKAGLGWLGKHTNILSRDAGSWFFLAEIYTDLPLPTSTPVAEHCGQCTACIDVCPTQAIIAPYELDARRCISYLTIEHEGSIPKKLRPLMGNRIYGCDDCQLICPWNRFSHYAKEADFSVRHHLGTASLSRLFLWTEKVFLKNMEGSAIRRIGYQRWQRNIAIALGNAPKNNAIIALLNKKFETSSTMVKEHIQWALQQQTIKK